MNTHYHANERLDGGHPVNNGTDRHRDCLADSLRSVIPAFAILGWELTRWELHDLAGTTTAEFTTEDGCGTPHTISILIWACTCESGEAELRARHLQAVAPLN